MQQASSPWGNHPSRDNGPYPPDAHPGQRHRAQTAPALPPLSNPSSYHPRPLVPGHAPQSVHRPDLFFSNSAPNANSQLRQTYDVGYPPSSPPPSQQYVAATHYQPFPRNAPPLPGGAAPPIPPSSSRPAIQAYRSLSSPPVPQKPSVVYSPPSIPSVPYTFYDTRSPSPMLPAPHMNLEMPQPSRTEEEYVTEEADDDGLAIALALSQSESNRQQEYRDKLASQEEEELSRALAESMLLAATAASPLNDFASSSNDSTDDLERALAESLRLTGWRGSSSNGAVAGTSSSAHGLREIPEDSDNNHVYNNESARSAPYTRLPLPSSPQSLSSSTSSTSLALSSRYENLQTSTSSRIVMPGDNDASSPCTIKQSKGKQRESISELPYLASEPMSEPTVPEDAHPKYSTLNQLSQGKILANDTQMLDDEALARRLASEEEEEAYFHPMASEENQESSAAPSGEAQSPDLPVYSPREKMPHEQLLSQPTIAASLLDDEALARKLAAEEEAAVMDSKTEFLPAVAGVGNLPPSNIILDGFQESSDPDSGLPSYVDAALGTSGSNSDIFGLEGNPPRSLVGTSPMLHPQLISSVNTESFTEHAGQTKSDIQPVALLRPENLNSPQESQNIARRTSSASSSSNTTQTSEAVSSATSSSILDAAVLNVNQFIDGELLRGVSIGFVPPKISAQLIPMQGPLPNIISLPYGKSPALHIHAPSWRHALKLMARMSGSRMEPAVEALAVTKSDNMKLRTVVQFVKTHTMSNEWRTVLWFTIDHPVPPSLPNLQRYNSQNASVLPWSYTLSKVPDLLRDASDGPLSKTYTIPATEAVPYPTLPITLPNLAMYLQAALDDSRNYLNDSSSSFRKFAKMMQVCYPSTDEDLSLDPPERSSVTGLFKRVIGRGPKNAKKGRGMNEDTYDLVTPFVPDEWG